MTILKAFKHKYCLSLGTCHKYVMQFTDPTPTVYLYAKRAKLTFCNYDSTKYNPIKIMFVPGYVWNAMYNLQTRPDHRPVEKKSKK